MVRIKEVSKYDVYDEAGNLLKGNFKDLEDALEAGVNLLLTKEELKTVKIKAEITLTKK
jgi:hypothetical protein